MGVQKPNGVKTLLAVVFILAFVFVKNLDNPINLPDMGLTAVLEVEPMAVVAIVRPRLAYVIMPYDEYTGRVGATPFTTQYSDYDACLIALFEKRAALKTTKSQYNMSIKCNAPVL